MQKTLPFAEAEGTHADRKNLLASALRRAESDCRLSVFVRWVFNTTAGGTAGELVKSYLELSACPYGLCCSAGQARRTAVRARNLGLVVVTENRYTSGGQSGNGYVIDWEGVRRLLGTQSAPPETGYAPARTPLSLARSRPVAGAHPPVAGAQPYKENKLLTSLNKIPEPVPEAGPQPEDFSFDDVPLLTEAARRPVKLLPSIPPEKKSGKPPRKVFFPEGLPCGIFPAIQQRHLRSFPAMIEWFRRQLSTSRPVFAATEADLLAMLAAATYATEMPADQVRTNRVAVFISLVSRGELGRAMHKLPAAERKLGELLGRYGRELLEGEAWPPGSHAKAQRRKENLLTAD